MRTECPVFKRCCFCLPLRHGLILWGYFKLITSCLTLVFVIFLLDAAMRIYRIPDEVYSILPVYLAVTYIAGIVAFADVGLTITYIVGCHQKKSKLLRIYYIYSIFLVVLLSMHSIFLVGISAYYLYVYNEHSDSILPILTYEISDAVVLIANIGIQIYMLLLVRSEVLKLEDNHQFRFVNHAAEAQCTLIVDNQGKKETEKETEEDVSVEESRMSI